MNEMIERVAAAMKAVKPQGSVVTYEELARAAIVALREPTKEMAEAGNTELENCTDRGYDSRAEQPYTVIISGAPTDIYNAMIDAALTSERKA